MNGLRKLTPEEIPAGLLEIPQPPKELYLEGRLPAGIYLAVVGSRNYSEYGKAVCEKIISELAGQPIVIVSGLALGIDAIAHRAALKAGLKTIAVPGSGLDRSVLYPSTNRGLADEIVANGGALLSEFAPTMRAATWTFPARNRLMAGLSKAVLVIEAAAKSGTLITSRMATDYNRDVLTVPGSILSPGSAGPHMLLRLGATPITSGADVIDALNLKPKPEQGTLFNDLSPTEEKVLLLLAKNPQARSELITSLELAEAEASELLIIMETKGLIRERLGEMEII